MFLVCMKSSDYFENHFYLFAQMKLPQIQKIMMEFEKQSEIMDMKEEMMNDAIDDAMGDEDDEEERYVRYKTHFMLFDIGIKIYRNNL